MYTRILVVVIITRTVITITITITITTTMIRTVMFPLDMSAFSSSKEKAEMAADFVSKAGLSSNTGEIR